MCFFKGFTTRSSFATTRCTGSRLTDRSVFWSCQWNLGTPRSFASTHWPLSRFSSFWRDFLFSRYLGPRQLQKYQIMRESIKVNNRWQVVYFNCVTKVQEQRHGVEAVEVRLTLGRQLLGITANVFVPTTILNVISFSTNHYKDDYFESEIRVAKCQKVLHRTKPNFTHKRSRQFQHLNYIKLTKIMIELSNPPQNTWFSKLAFPNSKKNSPNFLQRYIHIICDILQLSL